MLTRYPKDPHAVVTINGRASPGPVVARTTGEHRITIECYDAPQPVRYWGHRAVQTVHHATFTVREGDRIHQGRVWAVEFHRFVSVFSGGRHAPDREEWRMAAAFTDKGAALRHLRTLTFDGQYEWRVCERSGVPERLVWPSTGNVRVGRRVRRRFERTMRVCKKAGFRTIHAPALRRLGLAR